MNAYVCVYRRSLPKARHLRETQRNAENDDFLKLFLGEYFREDRYFDWGDDPSFFAARHFLADVRRASWGVCRPDVRSSLRPGDYVAFFCAKAHLTEVGRADYFFIGVGTVSQPVTRPQLWNEPVYAPYRRFYNVLARYDNGQAVQHEQFHPYHPNWNERLAPYIIFDPAEDLTSFNIDNPLWVATYTGQLPETWRSAESPAVETLEQLLFAGRGLSRRLRTSHRGHSHPKINLSKPTPQQGLENLRAQLLALVRPN